MGIRTEKLKSMLDHIKTVIPYMSNPVSIECYHQKMIYGSYEGICSCCIRCPYQWAQEEITCCASTVRTGGLA
jgi:hypothetical protein